MSKTSSLLLGHKGNRIKSAPILNLYSSSFAYLILFFFVLAAIYHIILQPYPNNWDDAWYAIHTFRWLDFIKDSPDVARGIFWGMVYVLPSHMPPLVFVTNLMSGLFGKSIVAMRYAQLIWFIILLFSVYGIGNKLGGKKAGLLSLILVSTTTLVFYWSKTIMGEPALFAMFALFLLLLVTWGENLTYTRSFVMGIVFGLGLLTKQHFLILVTGPILVWAAWYLFSKHDETIHWRQKLLQFGILFLAACLVAGPWYFLNLKEFISYITNTEGFLPHTIGSVVSVESITIYMRHFVSQISVPSAVLFLIGNLFALYYLGLSIKRNQLLEWKSLILLFTVIPGAVLLFVVIMQRNINTRFITPALIPWGILSGFALARFSQISKIKWLGGMLLLVLHLLFWWDQSYYPISSLIFPFFPKNSFMRPINFTPLPESLGILDATIPSGSNSKVYIVGETSRFNPDLVFAMIEERNYHWKAERLYSWNDPNSLEIITSRLSSANWIMLYDAVADRPDLFTNFYFDGPLTRFDKELLVWVKDHPETFKLVSKLESIEDNNRIWIFQISGSQ